MTPEEITRILNLPLSQELLSSGIPARVTFEPTWAKLLDFETTIPSAVQQLVEQHQQS